MLLVQEPKVLKVSEAQRGHKGLLALQVQPELPVLPALKAQQVLTVQMALTVLMEQQAHKDHKALPVLRVHKVIQD